MLALGSRYIIALRKQDRYSNSDPCCTFSCLPSGSSKCDRAAAIAQISARPCLCPSPETGHLNTECHRGRRGLVFEAGVRKSRQAFQSRWQSLVTLHSSTRQLVTLVSTRILTLTRFLGPPREIPETPPCCGCLGQLAMVVPAEKTVSLTVRY